MDFIIIFILILINGFFSLSEIAVISSKEIRLQEQEQAGSKGASVALKLRADSENFLSSVQVGITLVGLITGAYSGISLAGYLTPLLQEVALFQPYAELISIALIMFLTTYLTIVLGELVPKTVALSNPEKTAINVSPIIYVFSKIFFPFVKLLSASTLLITKIIGIKKTEDFLTETELRQMIKTASVAGVIELEQNTIHEKVFQFTDKRAKHLMTHRLELEWIDLNEQKDVIAKELESVQHNKIICCEDTLDNFVGVLFLKDYFKSIAQNKKQEIRELMQQPIVVHENTLAPKIFEQMKQNKTHICVVVDEYGDFQGIITFHDIMENFVGLIPDEGETIEPDYFVREDKSILVNGDAPIEVLSSIIENFNVDFELIDYSTVAGFVIEKMNIIPKVGDKFEFQNYVFEVVDMDGNRIDKILLSQVENVDA